MLKWLDHITTFPNTHRHFHLAIEILEKLHPLAGSRPSKEQLKKQARLDSQAIFLSCSIYDKKQPFLDPPLCKKNKGYPMHNSELRLYLNCASNHPYCCYTRGTKYMFCKYNFIIVYIRIALYILLVHP